MGILNEKFGKYFPNWVTSAEQKPVVIVRKTVSFV